MEGFKKSEGRSTRGASSLQYWLRPPPQNWMRPYDSCSSAPTALMKKLSTANLLSIHVLILRIFVFGGATRIVGAGSRQSQIGLSKGVLLANPLPGASGLGKLTTLMLSGQDQEEDVLVSSCKGNSRMIAPEGAGPRCNHLRCVLTGRRVLSYARVVAVVAVRHGGRVAPLI